ncbi:MAG: oxidoreductase [Beggiatoa sp. IS2]|nr:MAG: oxidoreductase [Beggiatoa sp. IS2]
MENLTFKALWVTEQSTHSYPRTIVERQIADLPAGEVLIKVAYSALNYKDALSATGNKGITRRYPHTPGIDAAGTVAHSTDARFREEDEVLVTGYDLGMNTAGGFADYIRVPAAWVVKLPAGLNLHDSMVYGTAGFTAALSVFKMQLNGLTPERGSVLVIGATGGVGSIAVAILAKLGYSVTAVTGKPEQQAFLQQLGAQEILSRESLKDDPQRPLLKTRWAGVVDTVGGELLVSALKATHYDGQVACCGMVAATQLAMTIFPFILRGVNLLGIASAECKMALRTRLWELLATSWKIDTRLLATECDLATLNDVYFDKILQGQVHGRIIVNLSA